jgi:hypothetical protein
MIWFIDKSIAFGSYHYLLMVIVYISDYRSLFYKQYNEDNVFQILKQKQSIHWKALCSFLEIPTIRQVKTKTITCELHLSNLSVSLPDCERNFKYLCLCLSSKLIFSSYRHR